MSQAERVRFVFVSLDTDMTAEVTSECFAVEIETLADADREILETADTWGAYGPEAADVVRRVGVPVAALLNAHQAASGPMLCPVCGGTDITGDSWDMVTGAAWQDVSCDDCGSSWTDCYGFTGHQDVREGWRAAEIRARRQAVRS